MQREKAIEEIMAGFQCIKRQLGCQVRQSGLTHSQWIALITIRENEGVGIKKIAEALGVSSSAATQLVDDLEQNGFVIRQINETDKRVLSLSLTEKAQEQFTQMHQERVRAFSAFFATLDDQEFAQYVRLAKKITNHISTL